MLEISPCLLQPLKAWMAWDMVSPQDAGILLHDSCMEYVHAVHMLSKCRWIITCLNVSTRVQVDLPRQL